MVQAIYSFTSHFRDKAFKFKHMTRKKIRKDLANHAELNDSYHNWFSCFRSILGSTEIKIRNAQYYRDIDWKWLRVMSFKVMEWKYINLNGRAKCNSRDVVALPEVPLISRVGQF